MKIENKCHEESHTSREESKNGIFYLNGETLDVFDVSVRHVIIAIIPESRKINQVRGIGASSEY